MKAQRKVYTLAFLKRDDDVLLGLKTRGLGAGLWNGFGGKVEPHESISDAARREIMEECGVEVDDLRHIGAMCYVKDGRQEMAVVHIFTGTQIRGVPEPSEEMNPVQWYHRRELPYGEMYPDFGYWYQHVLVDKIFCGRVRFNANDQITEQSIRECDCLEDVFDFMERQ